MLRIMIALDDRYVTLTTLFIVQYCRNGFMMPLELYRELSDNDNKSLLLYLVDFLVYYPTSTWKISMGYKTC